MQEKEKIKSKKLVYPKYSIPKIIIYALIILLIIFLRTYNIENTARFIWDESSDLVHIHQIYQDKSITLIGPISEDGNKVFGSLTYYMLLPFAVIKNFDPVSTAYGSSFWGIITAILLIFLLIKINPKFKIYIILLSTIFYPLLATSRWAWNPNLIPFWVTLSLIFYITPKYKYFYFLSGLFLAMTIHHHWISVPVVFAFWLVVCIENFRKQKIFPIALFSLGIIISILPFVIFDLTHPPGLFLSRILYFNYLSDNSNNFTLFESIRYAVDSYFSYLTGIEIIKYLLLILTPILFILDIKNKNGSLKYGFVWLLQLMFLILTHNYYSHYFLPAIIFFLVWIVFPRKLASKFISISIIILIILSSIILLPKTLTYKTWQTDIPSTRYISDKIIQIVKENNINNFNITVLQSPDNNMYGRRYRDLMLIKGILPRPKEEILTSDYLFIISVSDFEKIINDQAFGYTSFSSEGLIKTENVPDSDWKIYVLKK